MTLQRCVALLLITVVVYAEAVRGTEINKSPLDYEPMAKAGSKRRAVSDSMPKIPKLRRLVAFMSSPKTSRLHQPDTGNVTGDIDVGSGVDRNSGIRRRPDYELLGWIGAGAYGNVLVAKDARNPSRLVAIKRQNMSTPMRQHVALNEIRMLERLRDCPAIVQMFEAVRSPNFIYLMMEYLSRGTLVHRIMRQGRISERNTKRYLDDIISGVYACHMRGIILNDIKPANMAFDEDDNLKLIDFGLATYCPSRMMRVSTSTPNYASPEQFKLEDNQVKAQEFDGFVADAWAVGITLVQMLTGELLFPGRNADEVRRNILNCRMNGLCLEQWQRLSQGAKLLSQRILQRDTSRRLGIQGIGNDDWFQSDSDTEH
ncbi:non-specific serine/threonine protein kinase [Plasmodiophora brassicae]